MKIQTKNKITTLVAISIITTAILLYAQSGSAETSTSIQAGSTQTVSKSLDIAWKSYPYLENMTSDSTDIIKAKITSVKESYTVDDVPVIKFGVTVEKAIKGNLKNGDVITQLQIADIDPAQHVVDSDVAMKTGEEYILFLKYTPETNTYFSVGGPQGRFLIQNSMIYSMDNIDARANWIHVKMTDKPLADYESEILAKINGGTKN